MPMNGCRNIRFWKEKNKKGKIKQENYLKIYYMRRKKRHRNKMNRNSYFEQDIILL
jgi:hypothetical protein